MKHLIRAMLAATVVAALPVCAQNVAPEISFDSAPNVLTLPADIYLGEVGGVATNSRGDILVYTRTGHPTLSLGQPVRLRTAVRGCSSSIAPGTSRGRSGRACMGSCLPRRFASIRRTTSGPSTRCRRW